MLYEETSQRFLALSQLQGNRIQPQKSQNNLKIGHN